MGKSLKQQKISNGVNKDDLIKKLEHIDLPEIELQSHKRRLKVALLNSGYFKEQTTMSLLKKFAPVGAIVTVAVIALLVVVSTNKSTPAYAKEIAQKSYQTVVNLPADQQEALKHTLGMDSRTILQEALNAKDLKALTYDEFASQGNLPPDPDGKLRTLKFLQFTRTDGMKVILGIDENNMPVFASAGYGNPNPPAGAKTDEKGLYSEKASGKGLVSCKIENGKQVCTEANE